MPVVSDEERARFAVLLERIETKVGAIADGHGALDVKMDRIERKVDGLGEEVALLKAGVSKMDARLGRVEGRLDHVDTRLGRVEARLKNGHTPTPAPAKPRAERPAKKK